MTIDDNLINKLYSVSKLTFDDDDKEQVRQSLLKMLNFINTLNDINTDKIEPLIYLSPAQNIARKDRPTNEQIPVEQAIKNAPIKDSSYIKIQKKN